MKIILLVEGDTEAALADHLQLFLQQRARLEAKSAPRLETRQNVGDVRSKLGRLVELEVRNPEVGAVVGLVDVFPKYKDAMDAKQQLLTAAKNHPKFFAHAAQYDVEAWLLPYWEDICQRLKLKRRPPSGTPETVNGMKPPAYHLQELYRLTKPKPREYRKVLEMKAILKGKDLLIAAHQCIELKAFLNTLLTVSDLSKLA